MAKSGQHYRREIDGLRALAVIPVVLFHAGLPGFSGGYVGVDVFFVISGYLIGSLLIAESEAGQFSLARFYERRARRILPALFFMAFCLLPVAWLWMVPAEFKEFGDSLIALPLFVSNFLFAEQVGYFATEAEVKPLLHTWSLAVEEQFYIVVPVLFMLIWPLGRRILARILLALAVLSFFAALAGLWSSYLLPAGRVWELLAGMFCALWLRGRDRSIPGGNLAGLLGIGMIAASVVLFGAATPFPGFYTLLPVAGTVFIILGANADNLSGRVLGQRAFVGIGLISYSIYLWHQPLFAFARIRMIDHPPEWLMIVLALVSLGMGWLSWRFVERPFRQPGRFTRRQIFGYSAAAGIAIASAGLVIHLADGFPSRLGTGHEAATRPARSDPSGCALIRPLQDASLVSLCPMGVEGGQPVLLFGDSHADALYSSLDQALTASGRSGYLVKNPYCPPVYGLYDRANMSSAFVEGCEDTNRALFDYLATLDPAAIVVAPRWTYRAFPVEGLIERQTYDNGEGGVEPEYYTESFAFDPSGSPSQAAADKAAAIANGIEDFFDFEVSIVLVYPVPEVGWNVARRNLKTLLFDGRVEDEISTDHARFQTRNRFIIEALDGVRSPFLVRVKVEDLLCDTIISSRCAAQFDGLPLYYDDDHLSVSGANLVVDSILAALGPNL